MSTGLVVVFLAAFLFPYLSRQYFRSPPQTATGSIVIRYSRLYAALAMAGFAGCMLGLYVGFNLYETQGTWTGPIMLFLVSLGFAAVALQLHRKAAMRIEVSDVGVVWRRGDKIIAIDWRDATVDAVQSVLGVTIVDKSGEQILIAQDMVGASSIEPFVAKFIPRERVRLAQSIAGDIPHFFQPYRNQNK